MKTINLSGRVLIEAKGQSQLDVSKLNIGLYFIQIDDDILKFVKE